ncbi:hypothetical protein BD410DRAFT_834697 [Rickenella mellea]|uniref:ditrans,polycis-polyprenyl diphosphate synthase [(2E,6E)-farnesyldiphosphate specific] n=1 Tax=Rickenella mellea TaxID=50990 RepID=A0A4Y7QLV3_9AGAM|nr:hypothetical protein BD410DRAFT_834697 [Rickenella mellea]
MSALGSAALCLLHLLFSVGKVLNILHSFVFSSTPAPLLSQRRQLPKHVAIVLGEINQVLDDSDEGALVESVWKAADWCRSLGIQRLSVYDRNGMPNVSNFNIILKVKPGAVSKLSERIWMRWAQQTNQQLKIEQASQEPNSDSDIEYPLTPPDSDFSDSRAISPDLAGVYACISPVLTMQIPTCQKPRVKAKPNYQMDVRRRRSHSSSIPPTHSTVMSPHPSDVKECKNPLTISLLSYSASKPHLASISRCFATSCSPTITHLNSNRIQLTIDMLDTILEETSRLGAPDFLMVHDIHPKGTISSSLELSGYPPWQVRLTELYSTSTSWRWWNASAQAIPLDEMSFSRALDEFAATEMRLGK